MQLSHTLAKRLATNAVGDRPTPINQLIQCRAMSKFHTILLWSIVGFSFLNSPQPTSLAADTEYFAIQVVDAATRRGVPLVELKTTSQVSYWTDSLGYIALSEPGLWNREIYFHIASHGYEFEEDAFGYRGVKLLVQPGKNITIELRRINIAERLYRVTGAEIYRDSVLIGRGNFAGHSLNNANVTGCDSVLTALFRGKIYWFWGDTNLHHYPLGLFHASGATSELPIASEIETGKEPEPKQSIASSLEQGIALDYFVGPDGNAKSTCQMPGDGPTWLEGLTVTSDRNAPTNERMFASYAKIKPPLDVYERGLVEWNVEKQLFEHRLRFNSSQQGYPMGHPLAWTENGQDYFVWQSSHIVVYSPCVKKAIADARDVSSNSIRVAVVNLDFQNGLKQQVLEQLQTLDVDLLLLIEIDQKWQEGLLPLQKHYPHRIGVIRDDGLGIQLWSKLGLIEHEVRHLVSEDRASIFARIRQNDGQTIRFVGVHPLPPGLPSDDEQERHDSRIRDAELMLVAKIVGEDPDERWLVTGDFNDVAWSHTTRLFQRMSGLEDPRVGRGLYNTYHAKYFFLRFPIDQVFISSGAQIVKLSRIRPAGSDHFAIVTEFQLPSKETMSKHQESSHTQPLPSSDDREEAAELIEEGKADAVEQDIGIRTA